MIKVPRFGVHRVIRVGQKIFIKSQNLLSKFREDRAGKILQQYEIWPRVKIDEALMQLEYVPLEHYRIMKNEVRIGQFKQFVDNSGYKIEGHNADKLRKILADPSNFDKAVRYINRNDAMEYARWRNYQTKSNFAVPTKYELHTAMSEIGIHLSGEQFEWTVTKKLFSRDFFLLKLHHQTRSKIKSPEDIFPVSVAHRPDHRYMNVSLRLVEKRKKSTAFLRLM